MSEGQKEDHHQLKRAIVENDYSTESVSGFFRASLDGTGDQDGEGLALATLMFEEAVADGRPKNEAFAESYAFLQSSH